MIILLYIHFRHWRRTQLLKLSTLPSCTALPTKVGLPKVANKRHRYPYSQIRWANEGGYISATFDNVYVNGSPYDNFDSSNTDKSNASGGEPWSLSEWLTMVNWYQN